MSDATSEHDPFCPSDGGVSPCHCELIAQVRSDQRDKTAQALSNILQAPVLFFEQLYREQ